MRISQLADVVGVPTSTVRFYERIGLLEQPSRTSAGYRDYDDSAAERLLFVNRARSMGLSCDQISDLLLIWGGTNCAAAQDQVVELITDKQKEIADRITELKRFSAQLESVRVALRVAPPPAACRTDLSCCVPVITLGAVRRSAPS